MGFGVWLFLGAMLAAVGLTYLLITNIPDDKDWPPGGWG